MIWEFAMWVMWLCVLSFFDRCPWNHSESRARFLFAGQARERKHADFTTSSREPVKFQNAFRTIENRAFKPVCEIFRVKVNAPGGISALTESSLLVKRRVGKASGTPKTPNVPTIFVFKVTPLFQFFCYLFFSPQDDSQTRTRSGR